MDDRVFIFIDGSNLDMATKHSFKKRVSPELLAQKLAGERRLMKVNYYEAPLLAEVNRASFDAQQRFFEHLRMNPYFDVKLGRRVKRENEYKCPGCGHTFTKTTWEQKGVDTLIAFDLVALATRNAYDIAVIVAGDQDFVCPILEVRMMNKQIENAFTEHAWAPALKKVVDKAILLDADFLKDCWQK
jgi:uncharacterized LabA/DUF88 family protein